MRPSNKAISIDVLCTLVTVGFIHIGPASLQMTSIEQSIPDSFKTDEASYHKTQPFL